MTSAELQTWLKSHYPRGSGINRLAFVADVDATLEALGEEGICLSALNTWIARNPPERVAGRNFESFLALVLERKQQPPPARIYEISLPVDAETAQAIEEIAAGGGIAPEIFLRVTLYAQLAEEIEIHESAKAKKKRKKL